MSGKRITDDPGDTNSIPEKILIAMAAIDKPTFTASDIVIAAWEMYPQVFGLEGYAARSADSNKVLYSIMGKKGLVNRKLIERVSPKVYRLAPAAKCWLESIGIAKVNGAVLPRMPVITEKSTVSLTPSQEHFLANAIGSVAYERFNADRDSVTFANALALWGLVDGMSEEAIDDHMDTVMDAFMELDAAFEDGGVMVYPASGRIVKYGDVRVLFNMHLHLVDRFERHLKILRNRGKKQGVA